MPNKEHPKLIVKNITRGTNLVSHGRLANNFWTRFKGLIGSKPLESGEGLLIVPCKSIHTHFMGFSIDVVYIDKAQRVVGVDENMKPWRIGRIRRDAYCVVELQAGVVAVSNTQIGDQLQFEGTYF